MSEARPPMVTPSKLPNQGSVSGAPGSPQSPPGPLTEKKQRPANLAEKLPEKAADTGQGELQNPPVKTTADAESLPSGELDWDTALDTILKTLRKEKVETK